MIDLLIRHRSKLLVTSIGIIYLWFGTLKFFPGISPAEALAKETLTKLTFGLAPANITYFLLAMWEVIIGIFMILNFPKKWIIQIAMLHLLLTYTPLVLLPEASFNHHFYSLSLVGQYIIKNLVLLFSLLFIYPQKGDTVKA